jgi:hypothetical protein
LVWFLWFGGNGWWSFVGELVEDRLVVDPDVLASDEAGVIELHDMEDPESERTVVARDP